MQADPPQTQSIWIQHRLTERPTRKLERGGSQHSKVRGLPIFSFALKDRAPGMQMKVPHDKGKK
jgi:hypothetical protein